MSLPNYQINYQTAEALTTLHLPRKYTAIERDGNYILSVGPEYDQTMITDDSVITGKWTNKRKYQIHLYLKNKTAYDNLATVLQLIALAESAVIKCDPKVRKTAIYVHYVNVERWRRLGYWFNQQEKKFGKPTITVQEKKFGVPTITTAEKKFGKPTITTAGKKFGKPTITTAGKKFGKPTITSTATLGPIITPL